MLTDQIADAFEKIETLQSFSRVRFISQLRENKSIERLMDEFFLLYQTNSVMTNLICTELSNSRVVASIRGLLSSQQIIASQFLDFFDRTRPIATEPTIQAGEGGVVLPEMRIECAETGGRFLYLDENPAKVTQEVRELLIKLEVTKDETLLDQLRTTASLFEFTKQVFEKLATGFESSQKSFERLLLFQIGETDRVDSHLQESWERVQARLVELEPFRAGPAPVESSEPAPELLDVVDLRLQKKLRAALDFALSQINKLQTSGPPPKQYISRAIQTSVTGDAEPRTGERNLLIKASRLEAELAQSKAEFEFVVAERIGLAENERRLEQKIAELSTAQKETQKTVDYVERQARQRLERLQGKVRLLIEGLVGLRSTVEAAAVGPGGVGRFAEGLLSKFVDLQPLLEELGDAPARPLDEAPVPLRRVSQFVDFLGPPRILAVVRNYAGVFQASRVPTLSVSPPEPQRRASVKPRASPNLQILDQASAAKVVSPREEQTPSQPLPALLPRLQPAEPREIKQNIKMTLQKKRMVVSPTPANLPMRPKPSRVVASSREAPSVEVLPAIESANDTSIFMRNQNLAPSTGQRVPRRPNEGLRGLASALKSLSSVEEEQPLPAKGIDRGVQCDAPLRPTQPRNPDPAPLAQLKKDPPVEAKMKGWENPSSMASLLLDSSLNEPRNLSEFQKQQNLKELQNQQYLKEIQHLKELQNIQNEQHVREIQSLKELLNLKEIQSLKEIQKLKDIYNLQNSSNSQNPSNLRDLHLFRGSLDYEDSLRSINATPAFPEDQVVPDSHAMQQPAPPSPRSVDSSPSSGTVIWRGSRPRAFLLASKKSTASLRPDENLSPNFWSSSNNQTRPVAKPLRPLFAIPAKLHTPLLNLLQLISECPLAEKQRILDYLRQEFETPPEILAKNIAKFSQVSQFSRTNPTVAPRAAPQLQRLEFSPRAGGQAERFEGLIPVKVLRSSMPLLLAEQRSVGIKGRPLRL